MTIEASNTEKKIYVLNKRLKLFHAEHGFKTSIDSVLLASACPAQVGQHILDMGCGVGGAGFCVLSRVEQAYLTGVELQLEHVALAERNAVVNTMQERCSFVQADIRNYRQEHAFDHVICNPPYLEAGTHLRSPYEEKAKAMGHGEEDLTLKDWVDAAYNCVKSNGSFTMINRSDKVDQIISTMGKRFGAIEIIPLWPRVGVNAKRVIVRAIKHRKSPATICTGIVLHAENGDYTDEAEHILRDGKSLFVR